MKTTLLIILASLVTIVTLIVLVAAYNISRFKRKIAGEIVAIFEANRKAMGRS